MGDLLISGLEKPGAGLKLPTVDDIRDVYPEGSWFGPIRLRQKIEIISDHLAVGWAGNAIAAIVAIKALREYVRVHGDEPAKSRSSYNRSHIYLMNRIVR